MLPRGAFFTIFPPVSGDMKKKTPIRTGIVFQAGGVAKSADDQPYRVKGREVGERIANCCYEVIESIDLLLLGSF